MDLESRIDEQEGKIDALLDEIDGRDKTIRELSAQCAAMREALEQAIISPSWEFQHVAKGDVMGILDTTDAGRELLERHGEVCQTTERSKITWLNLPSNSM